MNTRLIVASAMMAGLAAQAQASLQAFSASPSYSWMPSGFNSSGPFPGMAFDPQQGPGQSGASTSNSITQWYMSPPTGGSPTELYWSAGSNVRISVTPVAGFAGFVTAFGLNQDHATYSRPTDFSAAASVGPGGAFASEVIVGWGRGFSSFSVDYALNNITPFPPFIYESLPESMVIGLELTISGQIHYGWALVHRTGAYPNRLGRSWQVERWAYETTPGAAAAIPAPGVAALFGLAGMVVSRRRR
ncbi:hypothetical protein [Nostoc sp. CHAB 5715]|uniref:hypothetical protein n=1 Tax=Nostoc sp. CHAB 5715 TaxID=2780400 RepID=UPI001E53D125|nr:hypothetical protein [Nostoc sp. CHAB 5715]MCC5621605.1 hypothetical protein [Nostoc sp. CHAB 5715]